MPRAMQSTAIPRRGGNPRLPCPRNSAIPLHPHSDHPAETRGAFSPQLPNTALEHQSYKELEIPIPRSQYLFLYKGADSTSFFSSLCLLPLARPTLQSRAGLASGGTGPGLSSAWAPVAATLPCCCSVPAVCGALCDGHTLLLAVLLAVPGPKPAPGCPLSTPAPRLCPAPSSPGSGARELGSSRQPLAHTCHRLPQS